MHQMGSFRHPTECNEHFFVGGTMAAVQKRKDLPVRKVVPFIVLAAILSVVPGLWAQSSGGQQPQNPPATQSQDIPDAPSTVQPPAPKPQMETPPPGVNPDRPNQQPANEPAPQA